MKNKLEIKEGRVGVKKEWKRWKIDEVI